jgi:hypothetical protein
MPVITSIGGLSRNLFGIASMGLAISTDPYKFCSHQSTLDARAIWKIYNYFWCKLTPLFDKLIPQLHDIGQWI